MKLSFTIPFYSTPEFLDAAIKSVLSQSFKDWELVVVDDRSPHKGIAEQVASYGDSRIRYHLNEKNLGQAGNWNECLRLAQGELVTILHADDMLQSNYAELMNQASDKYPNATGIFCGAKIVDGKGNEIFSFADYYKRFLIPSKTDPFVLEGESGLSSLIKGNFIMCPTLCFRKGLLGELKFSPNWRCAPDLDFTSRLLIEGGSLVGLPQIAFSYRRHEESGTAVFRRNMQQFEEEVALYDQIASLAEKRGWLKAAAQSKAKNIVKLRVAYFGLKEFFLGEFSAAFSKFKFAAKLLS